MCCKLLKLYVIKVVLDYLLLLYLLDYNKMEMPCLKIKKIIKNN